MRLQRVHALAAHPLKGNSRLTALANSEQRIRPGFSVSGLEFEVTTKRGKKRCHWAAEIYKHMYGHIAQATEGSGGLFGSPKL